MKRLISFARSVLPGDPAQLLFLCGSLAFFICMQLRCRAFFPVNLSLGGFDSRDLDFTSAAVGRSWDLVSIYSRIPIVFAGAAGLYYCFRAGARALIQILLLVVLPSVAGLVSLCYQFVHLANLYEPIVPDVLLHGPHNEAWVFRIIWSMGPALHVIVIGLVMMLIFVSRMAMGIATLPLSVNTSDEVAADDQAWPRRLRVFIWGAIAGLPLVVNYILVGASLLLFGFASQSPSTLQTNLLTGIGLLAGMLLPACAMWAVGANAWTEFKQFMRIPKFRLVILGVALPFVVGQVPKFVQFLSDWVSWTRSEPGTSSRPHFASYFRFWFFPTILLSLLIYAAFEEIVWRGYLQPRFIRRYGILRGIFLTGLVWSAFHFLHDFTGIRGDYEIAVRLINRLGLCVAMGFVLGWLTLRAGSIWPAVIAHGLHNYWVGSGAYNEVIGGLALPIVWMSWGIVAFVLFRFWPPKELMLNEELDASEGGIPLSAETAGEG